MSTAAAPEPYDELVARQCGVLSTAQAQMCGFSRDAVRAQLAARRWQRVHRGIYATFTGPLPPMARVWAAVLACGPQAVASHQTAAWLAGLPVRHDGFIHVSVPAEQTCKGPKGVRVHRSRRHAAERHPVARPPRTRLEVTVLDVAAASKTVDEALAVVAVACQRHLTTHERLADELAARRNQRWRSELLDALPDVGAGAHSVLEVKYVRNVERAHGLPPAERQVKIRSGSRAVFVDGRYKKYRTRLELDGRLGHDGPGDRARDMHRDNAAVIDGENTLRFGWGDVVGHACSCAAVVARVLQRNGWTGEPRRCGPSCAL